MQAHETDSLAGGGLLAADDIWPAMAHYSGSGKRTALVTLVGVEGGAPRTVGAQLAVCEDGRYHGYLSGGCLEQAVALEAVQSIGTGQNQTIRYGRGSKFIDVKLPCGSGMDLFFDCTIGVPEIAAAGALRAVRRPFAMRSDLTPGANARSVIEAITAGALPVTARDANRFVRVYAPSVRLVLFGSGPAAAGIAEIAKASGLDIEVWSPDDATRTHLVRHAIPASAGSQSCTHLLSSIDSHTAVIVAFHEHHMEPDLIARALESNSFYIGVLGSRAVHMQRLETLRAMGVLEPQMARIRAPIGLIPGAKSKATLAIGVIADLFAEAKRLDFVT
ncbi:MAG: XdhC family protein [Hyphomicrobium sp.]